MSFPPGFIANLQHNIGFDKAAFVASHDEVAPVSIRYNPLKSAKRLSDDPVPWCENACYLAERPLFVYDPLFHAGVYYVQEASSMFLDFILRKLDADKKPLRILDLCAAPGGKSTLIAGAMHEESILFSNEVIKTRAPILRENLTKWGKENVVVLSQDPATFTGMQEYFDIIVVDAPCSGSGLFRKEPAAIAEWSEENVITCSNRQQRILTDILPAIKPGGFLIYATCSYSMEEDEHVVSHFIEQGLTNRNDIISSIETQGIISTALGYRFYPDKIRGEGFFISILQKNNAEELAISKGKQLNYQLASSEEREIIRPWLKNFDKFIFVKHNNVFFAWTKQLQEALKAASGLNILQAGIAIGEIKQGSLIPHHALAMSNIISDNIPRIALSKSEALEYLRKNNIELNSSEPGWHIITYENIALGWVKMIPGRHNNYYPTEWRLRK